MLSYYLLLYYYIHIHITHIYILLFKFPMLFFSILIPLLCKGNEKGNLHYEKLKKWKMGLSALHLNIFERA